LLLAGAAGPAWAQISPGPLARPHERLEGSANCLKCHDRQGVAPEKCLACHTLLADRIASGQGLHARSDYRDCKRCHVDHQGREFELVFWGDRGRDRFDHGLAGWPLEGKHGRVACDDCHRKHARRTAAQLAAGGAAPDTLLGLETACKACHEDEHRGQFGKRDCAACHTAKAWKPATGFDHGRAAFPLEGRHADVRCDACHTREPGEHGTRRYVGIAFGDCSSCHKDPHRGRFGPTCASCHAGGTWVPRLRAGFDHDRTRYPLRGRHRAVACEGCHRAGRSYRLPHGSCTDCHADAHQGQLAARADHGRCESCHDVNGFVPARFGPEEHAQTAYPLIGAHLAVPCDACHTRRTHRGSKSMRFRLPSTRCADCHDDRHRGELDRYAKVEGCEGCHVVASWRQTRFDHSRARFALDGAHARVACARCHPTVDEGTPRERPRLSGVPSACQGCHRDPHAGQLTRAGLRSPCERCHTASDWKATRFDHSRDSAYALDGAHRRVPCAGCHKTEIRASAVVVRYRPLGTRCKDCHGAGQTGAKRGTP